jgi:hypothetical protein
MTNVRAICEGHFTVPLPVAAALTLFTPEGERRWAGPHWDPTYAIPNAASDDSAPGTVFATESDGGAATWIVVERREDRISYARVAPGRIAGTVSVECSRGATSDETLATVRYDVTSLGPDGVAFIEHLEEGYAAFLDEWRREILATLERERARERNYPRA